MLPRRQPSLQMIMPQIRDTSKHLVQEVVPCEETDTELVFTKQLVKIPLLIKPQSSPQVLFTRSQFVYKHKSLDYSSLANKMCLLLYWTLTVDCLNFVLTTFVSVRAVGNSNNNNNIYTLKSTTFFLFQPSQAQLIILQYICCMCTLKYNSLLLTC